MECGKSVLGLGKTNMMRFNFSKKKYSSAVKVWYDGVFLGTIEHRIKEADNIDWKALKEDKTKRLDGKDRWKSYFYAKSTASISSMGPFDSKEDAANALLNEHRRAFGEEVKK